MYNRCSKCPVGVKRCLLPAGSSFVSTETLLLVNSPLVYLHLFYFFPFFHMLTTSTLSSVELWGKSGTSWLLCSIRNNLIFEFMERHLEFSVGSP